VGKYPPARWEKHSSAPSA